MANLRVNKITSTETFETTGSVHLDGGSVLSVPNSADFRLGNDDFTIEFWFLYETPITSNRTLFSFFENDSVNRRSYQVEIRSDGTIRFEYTTDGSSGVAINSDAAAVDSATWYHYAVTRTNGIITQYLDGKSVSTGFVGTDSFFNNTDDPFRIGVLNAANDQDFFGFVTNFRLIKGTALYTANFKPPMRELEVVPGTVLLACQSKTDASLEKTGKTITVSGNADASELTPGILTPVPKDGAGSAITGSVEFNENDYLTLASSDDFNLGTGDFTIEFWIHPQKRFTSFPTIFEIDATDNANRLLINFRNAATLGLTSGTTVFATNAGFDLDEWYHIAVVRESGVSKIYKNGITGGDTACTADFSNSGSSDIFIGWDSTTTSTEKYNGFISNLRVVKGTALYTDNFIPPTRELKKVPGTSLLCCQDPDSPLTEATGKTITGFGNLNQSYGTDLVTNGQFTTDSDWTKGTQWTISGGSASITDSPDRGSDSLLTQDVSSWMQEGQMYRVVVDWSFSSGDFDVRLGGDSTYTESSINSSQASPYYFNIEAGGTNTNLAIIANQHAVGDINYIRVENVPPLRTGSNFTPQVGDGRSVTFEGVTNINTENYFYLPTGDTESRYPIGANTIGNGRAVFSSGTTPSTTNTVDYITISSKGDAQDFGGMGQNQGAVGTVSDSTRGIFAGGQNPVDNRIEYITISSTGDAKDFGDMTRENRFVAGAGNAIRGCLGGGLNSTNRIDYITIQSMGNSSDFGDLVSARGQCAGLASPTRGIFAGGHAHPSPSNSVQVIDFISIMSTGNAQDFGDLINSNSEDQAGASNEVRGLIAGGSPAGNANQEVIQYITIASTGDATDFGNLVVGATSKGGAASPTRAVFAGGYTDPGTTMTDAMDFVTITSTGNAQDFGNLTVARDQLNGVSNGHGGLG